MADGKLIVACGRTRSGKTVWVKRQVARGPLLVWDVEGQYEGCHVASTRRELVALAFGGERGGQRKTRISFQPRSLGEFGFWADVAFAWVRLNAQQGIAGNVVAEETSDVTTPAKAPDQWGILLRRGLKYGSNIYAITQRPSESDKTALGNCTDIHCCSLQRPRDREYMAAELDLPVSELESIDWQRLEYLHRDMKTGKTERGFLTFPR